jgi:hypothetical protein
MDLDAYNGRENLGEVLVDENSEIMRYKLTDCFKDRIIKGSLALKVVLNDCHTNNLGLLDDDVAGVFFSRSRSATFLFVQVDCKAELWNGNAGPEKLLDDIEN